MYGNEIVPEDCLCCKSQRKWMKLKANGKAGSLEDLDREDRRLKGFTGSAMWTDRSLKNAKKLQAAERDRLFQGYMREKHAIGQAKLQQRWDIYWETNHDKVPDPFEDPVGHWTMKYEFTKAPEDKAKLDLAISKAETTKAVQKRLHEEARAKAVRQAEVDRLNSMAQERIQPKPRPHKVPKKKAEPVVSEELVVEKATNPKSLAYKMQLKYEQRAKRKK